ncbi:MULTISPECIES: hypothetical protein [unclassified Capnocytophaga]|jgi:hypothetical protein|uniref:hypothetical protein n=1 Tax=unclassified Capnocytophaga TaxID=2640652 RepID=UPI000D02B9BB|nr:MULTISPECIES: hypothetical protein [unclassified Capnocytophaga]AVM55510.1 hypothetical protein C3V44_07685 [Capnocytophaga sp. oral taxon 864]QLF50388.1 hypothetical protein HW278_06520 [Capnocytophaga sp. oral taxon 902]
MKKLNLIEMESIKGGDRIEQFCAGFAGVAAIYEIAVIANLWNPVGWGAQIAGAAIGLGCAGYALR